MNPNKNATVRRSSFPPARLASNQNRLGSTRTSETPLRIKTFGISADEPSRIYIRERTGFKLGKFALHIQSLDIRLKDESGPHGEPLVSCSMTVLLDAGGLVVVERADSTSRSAFDFTIEVAERSVRRWLRHRHTFKRSIVILEDHDETHES